MGESGNGGTYGLLTGKGGGDGGKLGDDAVLDDPGGATPDLVDEKLNTITSVGEES